MTMQRVKSILVQDLYVKNAPEVKSSVTEVECYICGKGLQYGRITAKTLSNGMALFCDAHYSLQ